MYSIEYFCQHNSFILCKIILFQFAKTFAKFSVKYRNFWNRLFSWTSYEWLVLDLLMLLTEIFISEDYEHLLEGE